MSISRCFCSKKHRRFEGHGGRGRSLNAGIGKRQLAEHGRGNERGCDEAVGGVCAAAFCYGCSVETHCMKESIEDTGERRGGYN